VGERFLYQSGSPRPVDIAGIGKRQVWDVIAAARSPHRSQSRR